MVRTAKRRMSNSGLPVSGLQLRKKTDEKPRRTDNRRRRGERGWESTRRGALWLGGWPKQKRRSSAALQNAGVRQILDCAAAAALFLQRDEWRRGTARGERDRSAKVGSVSEPERALV